MACALQDYTRPGENAVAQEDENRMPHPPRPTWHHSPKHIFAPGALYMVTAGTLHKEHIFRKTEHLQLLQSSLFDVITDYGWSLAAWAIFSNHYHFIARAPESADDKTEDNAAQSDEGNVSSEAEPDRPKAIRALIQRIHSQTSRTVNKMDGASGRKVWFQFWDTCLTYENSYYARLNYVHHNPVKHGMAQTPQQYAFSSANWFIMHADTPFRKKVESFGFGDLKIEDDF